MTAGGQQTAATALAGILVLASLLRVAAIGQESFWYDETVTVTLAHQSYADILAGIARDNGNPQAFWIAARGWLSLVGDHDGRLRLLSAIFGVLGVAAVYFVGRLIFSVEGGLTAALLLAVNPGHVLLSQEFRAYTLMVLLSLLALGTAMLFSRHGSVLALVSYVVTATLGLYTHYYVGLVLVAANVWAATTGRWGKRFAPWCGAQLAILLLYLPASQLLVEQTRQRGGESLGSSSSLQHLLATPLTLLFGRSLVWKVDGLAFMALGLGLAVMLQLAIVSGAVRRSLAGERRVVVLAFAIPLALVAFLAIVVKMAGCWDDRKALIVLGPACLLMGQGLVDLSRRRRVALLTCIVLVSAASIGRYLIEPYRDDWRSVSAFIRTQAKPGDAILVAPDFEVRSLLRYLPAPPEPRLPLFGYDLSEARYVVVSAVGNRVPPGGFSSTTTAPEALDAAPRLWLVLENGFLQTRAPELRRLPLLECRARGEEWRFPRQVTVALYGPPSADLRTKP